MLKIAICDDDVQELTLLTNLLKSYQVERKITMKLVAFSNALELIHTARKESFDVLLLDIIMPGFNGMQAAHEIREFDSGIKIIFLTSSPEFAVDSYAVDAYYYLLKPCTAEKLFSVLDGFFWNHVKKRQPCILSQPQGCCNYT